MSSLYEKSLVAFSKHIDVVVDLETLDSVDILSHLPLSVERDVRKIMKTIWFHDTLPPEDTYNYEYRYLDFTSLDRTEFLMLINYPSELLVEFLPYEMQTCHVSFDYIEFKCGFKNTFVLCHSCFKITCSPKANYDDYDFEYLTFWTERNWKFYHVTKHFGLNVESVIDKVVKVESSWCDRCIFNPLFRFMDYSTCKESTHDHDNSNDSDVSVITSHNTFELYDPYHF